MFAQEESAAPAAPAELITATPATSGLEARIADLEARVAHLYGILGEEPPPPTL